MPLGYIGQEKNFVYIDGEPLLDVQSVESNISTNRIPLNIAGIGAGPQEAEGVSEGSLNIERYVITTADHDPFASPPIYEDGFEGLWVHQDSTGHNNYFAMKTGYINDYAFNAAVNSVPTMSVGVVAYGSGIGELDPAPEIPTPPDPDDFLDSYVYPRGIELTFNDPNALSGIVTTNRVQSFDLSFNMNREVKNRLGGMKKIPETFISFPFQATLSIAIDVDEYSISGIETLICQDPETIQLDLKRCDNTIIRSFIFTDGVLQSTTMSEQVREINTATLEYTRYVNNADEIDFWGGI